MRLKAMVLTTTQAQCECISFTAFVFRTDVAFLSDVIAVNRVASDDKLMKLFTSYYHVVFYLLLFEFSCGYHP